MRTRCGIMLHARALCCIIDKIVFEDQSLTEASILETHKILTYKVVCHDGDDYTDHGDAYRKVQVCRGVDTLTVLDQTQAKLCNMIREFNRDLESAL